MFLFLVMRRIITICNDNFEKISVSDDPNFINKNNFYILILNIQIIVLSIIAALLRSVRCQQTVWSGDKAVLAKDPSRPSGVPRDFFSSDEQCTFRSKYPITLVRKRRGNFFE